jgi:serine/threonine-protein kinase Chk2
MVAMLEDLSSNGTFVNEAMVGRNHNRELEDGDEISILSEARFVFRYPPTRETHGFRQQYRILQQLGKGHFATVYLCAERSTGAKYAVKVFERRASDSQKTQGEALQQEIAVLMGVNHPNLLCLKDTFDDNDGAYLVLELAPEGELFNLIVTQQKLSEDEARHVFRQLLEGLKYLVSLSTVCRENELTNAISTNAALFIEISSRRTSSSRTRN